MSIGGNAVGDGGGMGVSMGGNSAGDGGGRGS